MIKLCRDKPVEYEETFKLTYVFMFLCFYVKNQMIKRNKFDVHHTIAVFQVYYGILSILTGVKSWLLMLQYYGSQAVEFLFLII